jgi:beta-lactamase regulating signal transducer with metallopeptidase domain
MNASSYLIVLLQTTICLSIALFICAIARKSSGVRLIVSQMAIVVSAMILIVCSMVILQVKPIVSVSVPEAVAFTVPITNKVIVPPPRIETTPNQKGDNNLGQVEQRSATNPIYQTTSSFTISKLVSIVYGVGLAFSIFPMALGTWWIRRARKICLGVTAGTAFDVVKSISERHGIRTPRLYAGEAVTIPFVSGLFQKQIFVPLGWVNGPCDVACRAIIEHEVAHVVSRDLERKFLCRLACSLIWFQPLVWIAFRVMANASEELCDQRVLEAGVSNTSYANTLMQIRENAKRSNVPGLVIGAVSRESNLAKRMKLILAILVALRRLAGLLFGF